MDRKGIQRRSEKRTERKRRRRKESTRGGDERKTVREEGETKAERIRGGVQAVEEEQVLLTAPSSVPMVSSPSVCVCVLTDRERDKTVVKPAGVNGNSVTSRECVCVLCKFTHMCF